MLSRLFRRPRKVRPSIQHSILGCLEFEASDNEWQTAEGASIYHGGIPGDATGPDPDKAAEIVERLQNIDTYWQLCSEDLLHIAACYSLLPKANDAQQIFRVSALSLYPTYWEVCFETHKEYKWLYVGMQFEAEDLISNTIHT
jgi:hypothetical protein